MAKDNFSEQSKEYAAFRPTFPDELFHFIARQVNEHNLAWDVATGNGQSAGKLKPYFRKVIATDISASQLLHANADDGIEYREEHAEASSLANESADLINISQAIHWFRFDLFYKEVRRVAKSGAVIAAYCYSLLQSKDPEIDEVIRQLYLDSAPYWDAERKYVDEGYRSIPFPFNEIQAPPFYFDRCWTLDQLCGYIATWSANQHCRKRTGKGLVTPEITSALRRCWPGDGLLDVRFPVHIRIGRV